MKFLDVRKIHGKELILWCPDVVLVILFFLLRFVDASCEKIKNNLWTLFVCRRRLDFFVVSRGWFRFLILSGPNFGGDSMG